MNAIEYLHSEKKPNKKKFIHRNLRLDNILLNDKDEIKLTDFELSNYLLDTRKRYLIFNNNFFKFI